MSSKKLTKSVKVLLPSVPESESDDDSVLEATKSSTGRLTQSLVSLGDTTASPKPAPLKAKPVKPVKEKKPFVMTEARKASVEKMRLARGANVESRRVAREAEKEKGDAEKALVQKLKAKKAEKTQREIAELEHLQAEISSDDAALVAPKRAKKPKKVVYYSSSSDSEQSEDDRPARKGKKQPVNIVINNAGGKPLPQSRVVPKVVGVFV